MSIQFDRNTNGSITAARILRHGGTENWHYASLPWLLPTNWGEWIGDDSGRAGIYEDYQSWAAGKDLAYEFRDRPDLAVPEPVVVDWVGFQIAVPDEVLGVVDGVKHGSTITLRLSMLALGMLQPWQGPKDRLVKAWNMSIPPLTQAQRDNLNALAIAHNIPIKIEPDNKLVAK